MTTRLSKTRLRALAAVSAVALLTGACSGSGGSENNNKTFEKGTVDTPAASGPVDSFTWYGDYRSPSTLDPIKVSDYPELTVIPNICESLLRAEPDGTLKPGLATKWEQVDPQTVLLTMRQGVTFADGTPMTLDDVVFSLKRNLDPTLASAYSILYDRVSSIEPKGADQVEIKLKVPNVVFLQGMRTMAGAVVSKKYVESKGAEFGTPDGGVLCTGPYEVDSWSGAGRMSLKANAKYWDKDAAPLAPKMAFEFPADAKALANGIRGNVIDGAFNVPAELIPTLKTASNGKLWVGGEGSSPQNLDLIVSDLNSGPLKDAGVRRAISAAIDRSAIAKTAFSGAADPLFTVAGPGLWGYSQERYQAAYDEIAAAMGDPAESITEGKATIEDAGIAGAKVKLAYPGGIELYRTTATILQQTGEKLGLEVEIVALPLAQYFNLFSDAKTRAQFDAFLTMNYTQVQEPAFMYGFIGNKAGSQNYGGYDNTEVDSLLTQAFGEPSDDKRADLVIKAQKILAQDLPWIPIVAPRAAVFQNSRVTGAPLTFAFMGQSWAAKIGRP